MLLPTAIEEPSRPGPSTTATPSDPTASCDPLRLAVELLGCPSVTPADGGTLAVVDRELTALGFTCRRIDFEDSGHNSVHNLVAHLGTGAPHVAFVGHVDVVPPGAGWTVEPFAPSVREGVLYGRGACDMKGAIACFAAAVARFQAVHTHGSSGTISMILTGDEEADSEGGAACLLPHLAALGAVPDMCIVGEPTARQIPGDTVKIGRRGQLCGRVTARGVQGHSAYPERADNPLPRLVRFLQLLADTPLDHGSADFAPSTVSVTSIDTDNVVPNIIPAAASAMFDIRFNDAHTRLSLESRLRRLAAAQLGEAHTLELRCPASPFLCPRGPWLDVVARSVREVTGAPATFDTGGGTSDARFVHPHCPVVELGLVGATMHRADECVPLADLETLTNIYVRILDNVVRAAAH